MMSKLFKEITLDEYEDDLLRICCYDCEFPMAPDTITDVYYYKNCKVTLNGIHVYRCPICNRVIYSYKTAKMAEKAIFSAVDVSEENENDGKGT